MVRLVVNAVIFQSGWVLSVLFGNLTALACGLVAALLYARYFNPTARDAPLFAAVVTLGFAGDSLLGLAGVLVHPSGLPFPPPWMMVLWLLFAMTLPWSLRPLTRHGGAFLALCMVGGTLSYVAGERLTTVDFGYGMALTAGVLAIAWLAHGAILLAMVRRWERAA